MVYNLAECDFKVLINALLMWPKECSEQQRKKRQIFLQRKACPEITFNLETITYYK